MKKRRRIDKIIIFDELWRKIIPNFVEGVSFVKSCRKLILDDTTKYEATIQRIKNRNEFNYKAENTTDLSSIKIQVSPEYPRKTDRIEYVYSILKIFHIYGKLTSEQYHTFKGEVKKGVFKSFFNWCKKQGYAIHSLEKSYHAKLCDRIVIEISMLEESPEISAVMDMTNKYPKLFESVMKS